MLLDEHTAFRDPKFAAAFVGQVFGPLAEACERLPADQLRNVVNSAEFCYLVYGGDPRVQGALLGLLGKIEAVLAGMGEGDQEVYAPYVFQIINRLVLQDDSFSSFLAGMANSDQTQLNRIMKHMLLKCRYPFDYHIARGYCLSIIKLYFLFRKTPALAQYLSLLGTADYLPYLFSKLEDVVYRLNQPSEPAPHWLYDPEELAQEDLLNEGPVARVKSVRRQEVCVFAIRSDVGIEARPGI